MSLYYLCTDNFREERLSDKIEFDWKDEIIGRKIQPTFYDTFKKFEADVLSGPDYTESNNIRFRIETEINKNGIIAGITCSKKRDYSLGNGKAERGAMVLTRTEINEIRKFYDSVTVDNPNEQYNKLIRCLEKESELTNGYRFIRANGRGIYASKNNREILIPKKAIILALRISRKYIEATYSEEFIVRNRDYFKDVDATALIAVLDKVDVSLYWNLDKLKRSAKARELIPTVEMGYEKLCDAVKNNSLDEVREWIDYAPVIRTNPENGRIPLAIAVKNGNAEIIMELLANGACVVSKYKEGVETRYVVCEAIDSGNYEIQKMFAEVLKNHNFSKDWTDTMTVTSYIGTIYSCLYRCSDFETVRTTYPSTVFLKRELDISKFEKSFSIDEIKYLSSLDEAKIKWNIGNISIAYEYDRNLCEVMLKQGCNIETLEYFADMNDIDFFRMALSVQEPVKYSPMAHSKKAKEICEKGREWYEAFKQNCDPFDFNMFCRYNLDKH